MLETLPLNIYTDTVHDRFVNRCTHSMYTSLDVKMFQNYNSYIDVYKGKYCCSFFKGTVQRDLLG